MMFGSYGCQCISTVCYCNWGTTSTSVTLWPLSNVAASNYRVEEVKPKPDPRGALVRHLQIIRSHARDRRRSCAATIRRSPPPARQPGAAEAREAKAIRPAAPGAGMKYRRVFDGFRVRFVGPELRTLASVECLASPEIRAAIPVPHAVEVKVRASAPRRGVAR